MSHHGRVARADRPGSHEAIRAAYRAGYRWFQIDVVACRDDLVSLHAVFGRRRGFGSLTVAQVRVKLGYEVPTLAELLHDHELRDARWNVEVKSRTALPALIRTLKHAPSVSRVMVSAPMHPSIVREVRETFGSLVAVTAPIHHGGTLGRLFTTPRFDHDGLQVFRWFGRRTRQRHGRGRTSVQSWTIATRAQLDDCLASGCHPVVRDSDDDTKAYLQQRGKWPVVPSELRRVPGDVSVRRMRPARAAAVPIEVLLLGGGGWRGAFGSIGTVAYLQVTGRWQHIRHVVGISGGSFVPAALGSTSAVADDDPSPRLAELARRMAAMGARMKLAIVLAIAPLLAVAGAAPVAAPRWSLVFLPTVLLYGFRGLVSVQWRRMLGSLFDDEEPAASGPRRYVVCATGRSSARPHFFVAGDATDVEQPGVDPLTGEQWGRIVDPGWRWVDAVVSSTALPWVQGYVTDDRPELGEAGRAERLIDGGVVGIFGQQWFERTLLGPSLGAGHRTLAVDTGRKHRTGGRVLERLMGVSTVGLMSRWVQIALDASFRKEIERASRAEASAPEGTEPMMTLVRVAETDAADHHEFRARRDEVLRRLEHARCIVRRFGLTGLGRRNGDITIVAAVVACIADLEHDPTVESVRARLAQVGAALQLGDALAVRWDEL